MTVALDLRCGGGGPCDAGYRTFHGPLSSWFDAQPPN